jgi:hypothetical protein
MKPLLLALLTAYFVVVAKPQQAFEPQSTAPLTVFKYKCVIPKGWSSGSNASATYWDVAPIVSNPVFHNQVGMSLMGIISVIDTDEKLSNQVIELYRSAAKRGAALPQRSVPSGELYAFFINKGDKPYRMALPNGHGRRSEPRFFAEVYVLSKTRLFAVSFSSRKKDMVADAVSVATSYRPVPE